METSNLTKEHILGFLRENKDFLKEEFDIDNIILFGSFARDEAGKKSDINILIDTKTSCFDNRFRFTELLKKEFKRKVTVTYLDSVRTFIMRCIKDDMVYA